MIGMDSWVRGRGRSRVVVEVGPPARPAETDEPQPSRPLVSQGVRSERPTTTESSDLNTWLRDRMSGEGDGVWDRLDGEA